MSESLTSKTLADRGTDFCRECGMHITSATEYHPFAACLMFKACGDPDAVTANLTAAVDYGRRIERQRHAHEPTPVPTSKKQFEDLTITSESGNDFDIQIDHEGDFLIGISPKNGDSKWICLTKAQTPALRDWLNSVIPADEPSAAQAKREVLTLHGFEIMSLVRFLGGEPDVDVSIARFDAAKDVETGEDMPAGHYAWCTEYPEEGRVHLRADPPDDEYAFAGPPANAEEVLAELDRLAVKPPSDAQPVAWRRWLSSGKWFYVEPSEDLVVGDDWQPLYGAAVTKNDRPLTGPGSLLREQLDELKGSES